MLDRRKRHLILATLLILALAAVAVRYHFLHGDRSRPDSTHSPSQSIPSIATLGEQLTALQTKEQQLDKTIWAKELLAQKYGAVVESLWNQLNLASNKLALASSLQFAELIPFNPGSPARLDHEITLLPPGPSTAPWTLADWNSFISQTASAGWELKQAEFRHNQFDAASAGLPPRSVFYVSIDLENLARQKRATVEGNVTVHWDPDTRAPPTIYRIDASRLAVKTRSGPVPFTRVFHDKVAPPNKSYFVDPLIVADLDSDGSPEIILAASDLVFRRQPDGRYSSEPLTRHGVGLIFTGLIADFTGSGASDLICAKFDGLWLFEGSAQGRFNEPPRLVWTANPRLKYAQALSCGDIDADGDLDLWLGQYKAPYDRGQMPTPYYDAKDGHPDFLLRNDGNGNFTDITVTSGLEAKRHRRTYSGSLVDLDTDGDLDLVVVSDFAGVDLYANDGRGNFQDVTAEWFNETHAFGMAHAVTDFNADGALDFLMIGMNSPTADRLDHADLTRPGFRQHDDMRSKMTFGNRLFFRNSAPPYLRQNEAGKTIARAGWAWGCGAADLDNDGFPDVYLANGHESRHLVNDYESEFWLHDIYVSSSKEDLVLTAYFGSKFEQTRGQGFSYGGYEKNRFYWNQNGADFVEAAFLMGVGLQADSRNVIAEDLNEDGRPDLIVTTFEVWPEVKQTIQVFQNDLTQTGNWISLRFSDRARGDSPSPIGAHVVLHRGDHKLARQIVTGDSYRSQHSTTVHFGIGKMNAIDRLEIRWVGGEALTLHNPAVNRYHEVTPPRFDNAKR